MSIRTKAEREAIERIDSAILTAVKLLYTVDKPPIANAMMMVPVPSRGTA